MNKGFKEDLHTFRIDKGNKNEQNIKIKNSIQISIIS